MGLLSFFRRKALTASPAVVEALQDRRLNVYPPLGGTNQRVSAAYQRGIDASYGWIYATQPAVRSVVDFQARNVAQLALKLYERVGDTERQRDEDHPAAQTLANPDGKTPADAFIYRLVTDYLIWDNAYVLKFRLPNRRLVLVRLPPGMVQVAGGRFTADTYTIWRYDGTYFSVAPEDILHWFGYHPEDPLLGLSKLDTLRQELAGDRANQAAFVELAKSGLKGGYIKRPLEAPEWNQDDAERFAEQFRTQKMRADGRDPILEEGMTWEEVGISPKDAQLLPNRQFTREEVAREYGMEHCPPEDEDERTQFYADVLTPITKSLAGVLYVDILRGEYNEPRYYFEFDLNSKLKGDPENRFPALTASAGRPWKTVNEVRASENLPPINGGDDLTIPLNVALAGEQGDINRPQLPAPNTMPPQDPNDVPQDGSHREQSLKATPLVPRRARADQRRDRWAKEYEGTLIRHFNRQQRSVKSSNKAATEDRWNGELANDLRDISERHFKAEGDQAGFRLATPFDATKGQNWLSVKAQRAAEAINAKTQENITQDGPDAAFALARDQRAPASGMGYATDVAAFAGKVATELAPGKRMVTIDGGECEVCAPFQGSWPAEDVPGWPSYHPGCNCVADPF